VSTTIKRLLTIQDRDRKIAQLTKEQADVPARIKDVETRLEAHKASLEAAREEQQKNQAAMKELEVEIDSAKQRIAKYREQQLQIKNNTEYKALDHEIETVGKEIRKLEDRELELMEIAEEKRVVIAEREKDLGQEEKRVQEDQKVLQKRLENIEAEIHDLKIDREALAKDVDAEWLARYERIFSKLGDFAIVPVEHGSCGGCHMNLPPQVVHNAKKDLTLTICNFCGRMLYWQD